MHMTLDGTWQLRWDVGEHGDRIRTLLAGSARLDRAWPAQVPGCVHAALLEQGVIADPNHQASLAAQDAE